MKKVSLALFWTCRSAALLVLFFLLGVATQASAQEAPPDIDQVLQELEEYAIKVWDPAAVPGMAYAVVKGGETVYTKGFGTRSKGPSSGSVDERTLFEIGSTTKAFNAAVVGTVVDEGKAAWSDRVRVHLPDFKMYDKWVTGEFLVEDLMAQRSGMPPYSLDMMSFSGFGRGDIMRAIRLVEPVSSFRSKFGYQNNLHLWAAELVEKKTGLTWEEAVKRRLLSPLGMSDSTFDAAAFDANPNHAMGHIPQEDGSLWMIPSDWPYRGWLTVYAPAGGLMSNVTDMAKWVAFQLGNGSWEGKVILKPETVEAIRAPRIYRDTGPLGVSSYAMGWTFQSSPQTPWYVHDGETAGMHSIVAVYPKWDLGIVVLTNQSGNALPERLAVGLLNIYSGSEPPSFDWRGESGFSPFRKGAGQANCALGSEAAIPLGKLAGTYENPAYGKAIVKKEGGSLTMTLGPAKRLGTLSPLGGDSYLFEWKDWPGMSSVATFKANSAGEVAKLNLTGFEDVRGGDFKKVGN